MRKVVDAATVAHLWANQVQDEARTPNNNFYFYNGKIYSYGSHFLVGNIVQNDKGETAVLLSTQRYSNTTEKHKGYARNASRHLKQIFVVNPGGGEYYNFEQWLREIKAIEPKLASARKPEIYLTEISRIYTAAKVYADFFGYEIPTELQAYADQSNTPELIAAVKEREGIKKAAEAAKLAETLALWKDFEFTGYFNNKSGFDYLRYDATNERVETSQGVKIPADAAKEFYTFVLQTIANGGCDNCNRKLLYYQVTAINSKFIVVGCHKIEVKEIKALTSKLGW